eukprot:CFRG4731T1
MQLTHLAIQAAACFSAMLMASAHVSMIPNEVEMGTSVMFAAKVPHGGSPDGTTKIIITMAEGTYSVKPRPVYGFNMSETLRVLDPPVEYHGRQINETVDTVEWTAIDDYELPTWGVELFEFFVQLPANMTGDMPFKVQQQLSNGEWYNWTSGESTMSPYDPEADASSTMDHSSHGRRSTERSAPMVTVTAEDPVLTALLAAVKAASSTNDENVTEAAPHHRRFAHERL